MVDKIKLAEHSDATRLTAYVHLALLEDNLEAFLGVEQPDTSSVSGPDSDTEGSGSSE